MPDFSTHEWFLFFVFFIWKAIDIKVVSFESRIIVLHSISFWCSYFKFKMVKIFPPNGSHFYWKSTLFFTNRKFSLLMSSHVSLQQWNNCKLSMFTNLVPFLSLVGWFWSYDFSNHYGYENFAFSKLINIRK